MPYKFGPGSLKSVLALYFLPISILPAIVISLYSTKLFQQAITTNLISGAASERDAILAEFNLWESGWKEETERLSKNAFLVDALLQKNAKNTLRTLQKVSGPVKGRVYQTDGQLLVSTDAEDGKSKIAYLPKNSLRRVQNSGLTVDRYLEKEKDGFLSVIRYAVRDRNRFLGVVELSATFGNEAFSQIKNRRQIDLVLFRPDLSVAGGSFALAPEAIRSVLETANQASSSPISVYLGSERFSAILYPVKMKPGRQTWGYLGLFLSMTNLDSTMGKLRAAMIYLTLVLVLTASFLIIVFSRRLVKPIDILVNAMKRVKVGRMEQIPEVESTDEIEYLIRSFNDMSRNIGIAKRALEQKIGELREKNEEIKETQSHLVQTEKLVSLGQLVAGVAHELNNPIGFIHSNMQHLADYVKKIKIVLNEYQALNDTLPAKTREHMEKLLKENEMDYVLNDLADLTKSCQEGAERTKDIVLGLRTFSRMDESKIQEADIHEGLKGTLKLLGGELRNKVTVHEEYGEIPRIECNISQLNQVFMNLISNAAQAIEGKGDIWIRTRQEKDEVIIEVEDNGQGISKENLAKIFDPFFTTKKVGKGTGLGLSIAYGLIERHHGKIQAKSEVGKGSLFQIRLPLQQPAVSSVSRPSQSA